MRSVIFRNNIPLPHFLSAIIANNYRITVAQAGSLNDFELSGDIVAVFFLNRFLLDLANRANTMLFPFVFAV